MSRAVLCLTVLWVGAGAALGDGPTSAPAGATRPTTAPAAGTGAAIGPVATRPTTGPVLPEVPTIGKARVDELVGQLSGQRYQERRAAQGELEQIVNYPGVGEILKGHLQAATDPEAKAILETLVEGYDQPLAMVWCRSRMVKTANSTMHYVRDPGYPWLFVRGDGEFVYDAGCGLFTGKADESPRMDVRRGKLTPPQSWAFKEIITRSGLPRKPPLYVQPTQQVNGLIVVFYMRSAGRRRVSVDFWALDDLAKRVGEIKTDLDLALTLRNFLAACPATAYDGPQAARAEHLNRPMTREQITQLSNWPVVSLNLQSMFQPGGVLLNDEQGKAVRAALAKTDTYRFQDFMGCQVSLVPYLKDANEINYNLGR